MPNRWQERPSGVPPSDADTPQSNQKMSLASCSQRAPGALARVPARRAQGKPGTDSPPAEDACDATLQPSVRLSDRQAGDKTLTQGCSRS